MALPAWSEPRTGDLNKGATSRKKAPKNTESLSLATGSGIIIAYGTWSTSMGDRTALTPAHPETSGNT
jgi:hypothetical protein